MGRLPEGERERDRDRTQRALRTHERRRERERDERPRALACANRGARPPLRSTTCTARDEPRERHDFHPARRAPRERRETKHHERRADRAPLSRERFREVVALVREKTERAESEEPCRPQNRRAAKSDE